MEEFRATDCLQVKIDKNTATSHVLVAGTTGKRILVVGLMLVVGASAVNVTFEDEDGTDITGPLPFGANGGVVLHRNIKDGHFHVPTSGKGLNMLLSGAVQASGILSYRLID